MPVRLILLGALIGCALPTSVSAQVFDRQFTASESISERSDEEAVTAFRSFVGRHAFGGKLGGFFGCGAAGGGECNAIRKTAAPHGRPGHHRSEGPSDNGHETENHSGQNDHCSPST